MADDVVEGEDFGNGAKVGMVSYLERPPESEHATYDIGLVVRPVVVADGAVDVGVWVGGIDVAFCCVGPSDQFDFVAVDSGRLIGSAVFKVAVVAIVQCAIIAFAADVIVGEDVVDIAVERLCVES